MGLKSSWMLSIASLRKRSTSCWALARAMRSFERYVMAMMVKKTGTVRTMNDVGMLGLSRKFRKMFMDQPSWNPMSATFQGDRRSYPIKLSPSMQRSAMLHRRAPHVPIRRLLEGMAGGQDRGFVEGAADNLEAHRHAVRGDTARQGERRMAAHVDGRGVAQPGRDGL